MKTLMSLALVLVSTGLFAQASRIFHLPVNNSVDDVVSNHKISSNGFSYTTDRYGVDSGAIEFDGSNQFIEADSFGSILPKEEVSISFWVKADKVRSHNLCMMMPNNSSNRMSVSVYYSHNGVPTHFWDFTNTSGGRLGTSNITFDSSWHFFVFTSSVKNQKMQTYLDGVLLDSKSGAYAMSSISSALRIGGGKDFNFDGAIDEFSVFNGILDSNEVKRLYNDTYGQANNGCIVLDIPIISKVEEMANGYSITSNGYSYVKDRFGIDSGAIAFDGANQYIEVDSFGTFIPKEEITISFWVKADKVRSHNLCMMMPNNESNRMSVSVYYSHHGNPSHFWDYKNTSTGRLGTSNIGFDSAWHFFAFTSSKSGDFMKSYEDGKLFATKSNALQMASSTAALRIGGGKDFNFDGAIDEFKIFSCALDSQQIDDLYNGKFSSIHKIEAPTFVVYPNPTSGIFNVKLPIETKQSDCVIRIYNSLGASILEHGITSHNTEINLSSYAETGLYFVEILNLSTGSKTIKKLIYK